MVALSSIVDGKPVRLDLDWSTDPGAETRRFLAGLSVGAALTVHDPLGGTRVCAGFRPRGTILGAGFRLVEEVRDLAIFERVGDAAHPSQSVLLCAWRGVTAGTYRSLMRLARQGIGQTHYDPDEPVYSFMDRPGDAAIDRARSMIVTQWWQNTPDDVFIMIDDDIIFEPVAVNRVVALAREKRAIACGAYSTRGATHFACQLGDEVVRFAPDAAPVEIRWAATGFMAVHRDVIDALIPDQPFCDVETTGGFYPLFQPFPMEYAPGLWTYQTEDFAFNERARRKGFRVWLDPAVYLEHEGTYRYTPMDVLAKTRAGTGYLRETPSGDTPDDDLAADPRLAEVAR